MQDDVSCQLCLPRYQQMPESSFCLGSKGVWASPAHLNVPIHNTSKQVLNWSSEFVSHIACQYSGNIACQHVCSHTACQYSEVNFEQ